MFAALSRHANSVKYTPLGRSRLQLRTFRFFNSRRHAIIAAAVLLVLILLVTSGISRRQIGGSHDWSFGSLPENVDWSHFAYTQYATNAPYLCNSVMLFERLHRLGSRAERLLMYPSRFEVSANGTDGQSWESGLLRKARDEYNVKLKPVEVVQRDSQDGRLECFQPLPLLIVDQGTWAESYTKLLAFNQTQYARVLQLDSDSTLLQVCLWIINNGENLADLAE